MWPHAVEAARSLGVPPHFLVAHAALETGWGRHEPRLADGSPSFNLFGVKAGRRWQGSTADAMTTEFINGVGTSSRERFRAYGSYGESFRDYAALLAGNPRFASVLGATDGTEFARKLQQTGYATDPMYADKLARIIHGTTLRQALFG
jgi:flagellar protein FlgJ